MAIPKSPGPTYAERLAARDAALRELVDEHERTKSRLADDLRAAHAEHERAEADAHAEFATQLERHEFFIATGFTSRVDRIIAKHVEEPSRAVAAELVELARDADEQAREMLNAPFALAWHLRLALIRAIVANDPSALGSLSGPPSEDVMGLIAQSAAHAAAAVQSGQLGPIVEALSDLEGKLLARAKSPGGDAAVGAERLKVIARCATQSAIGQALAKFEAAEAEATKQRGIEGWERHRDEIARVRRGEDLGWTAEAIKVARRASSAIFGPLVRAAGDE
jgi:hypothetical protein